MSFGTAERGKCHTLIPLESHSRAYMPPPSALKASPYEVVSDVGAAKLQPISPGCDCCVSSVFFLIVLCIQCKPCVPLHLRSSQQTLVLL